MPAPSKFSVSKRFQSFVYAFRGLVYFVGTQHNVWIHLFITLGVIIFGFFFQISLLEWCLITLVIGFVLVAEAFNTAVEVLIDLIRPEYYPKAGLVKDIAAAAVLLAALISAGVGLLIFLPKFYGLVFR